MGRSRKLRFRPTEQQIKKNNEDSKLKLMAGLERASSSIYALHNKTGDMWIRWVQNTNRFRKKHGYTPLCLQCGKKLPQWPDGEMPVMCLHCGMANHAKALLP
jgi:hypothetical protein